MKFLVGKKMNMTRMFDADGRIVPLTMIQIVPNWIVGYRTPEKDGYSAVIVGAGTKGASKGAKAQAWMVRNGVAPRVVVEFRVPAGRLQEFEIGSVRDSSVFEVGERVTVVGTSKGRGFAGVVKRHHFGGHPTSHGHKDQERMPGSIGAGGMQHVQKGRRMAGRMGGDRVTVRGLKVRAVDVEKNIVAVSGSVPGARNSWVIMKSS